VPPDGLPALDLAGVLLRRTAAHVVAAVPLERGGLSMYVRQGQVQE
jgi:hypothetical protein